ncbi:MAG: hypothetical protein SGPRY_002897 [Prymnesium sp.]
MVRYSNMHASKMRRGEHIKCLQLPDALEMALEESVLPRIVASERARRSEEATMHAGKRDAKPSVTVDDFVAMRLDLAYAAHRRALHEASRFAPPPPSPLSPHLVNISSASTCSPTARARRYGAQGESTTLPLFLQATCRMPDFYPTRVLEFGAGLAAGCWAAKDTWEGGRQVEYTAVEPNASLRATGAMLADAAPSHAPSPRISWRSVMPEDDGEGSPLEYDLVICAYSLSALNAKAQLAAVDALWGRTAEGGVLLLIEQKEGAQAMSAARLQLMGMGGARIIAPFPRPPPKEEGEEGRAGVSESQAVPWEGWLSRNPKSLLGAAKRSNILEKVTSCHMQQRVVESVARQVAMSTNFQLPLFP